MSKNTSIVAISPSHTAAEVAVKEFMKKLSIVGRDYHTDENVVGYHNTGDRMNLGLWFWDTLGGRAVVVSWIVGAIEGAIVVGSFSAIGAGLYSLGIPKDSILWYETALKAGKFVLIAHGSMDEIKTCPINPQLHFAGDLGASSVNAPASGWRD